MLVLGWQTLSYAHQDGQVPRMPTCAQSAACCQSCCADVLPYSLYTKAICTSENIFLLVVHMLSITTEISRSEQSRIPGADQYKLARDHGEISNDDTPAPGTISYSTCSVRSPKVAAYEYVMVSPRSSR